MADRSGELYELLVEFPAVLRSRFGFVDDDMVQDGREAMVRAAVKWDAASTVPFRTFVRNRGVWDAIETQRTRKHSRSRHQVTFCQLLDVNMADNCSADPLEGVLDRVAAAQTVQRLRPLIDRLSARDRAVISRYVAGESGASIGASLGLDPSRACQIVARFRQTAASRLKEAT